jgi:hypothetical protein
MKYTAAADWHKQITRGARPRLPVLGRLRADPVTDSEGACMALRGATWEHKGSLLAIRGRRRSDIRVFRPRSSSGQPIGQPFAAFVDRVERDDTVELELGPGRAFCQEGGSHHECTSLFGVRRNRRSRRPRSTVHASRGVRQTSAGLGAARLLPALLAVAPVMWATQNATVPRTDAESGPIALGSPPVGRNRLPGVRRVPVQERRGPASR